ncbi:50S ribosomal protein L32e [uncultured archaeon]|nr:50S ribosomal protein L32e [uncultured archaeon]
MMLMVTKKKIPQFKRPNYGRTKCGSIKGNWRKPRGIDNKKRIHKKFMGCSPAVGYRQDKRIRGMHPTGQHELLVENMKQLAGASNVLVRIAGGVGAKLKSKLVAKAQEMKLRVLNP